MRQERLLCGRAITVNGVDPIQIIAVRELLENAGRFLSSNDPILAHRDRRTGTDEALAALRAFASFIGFRLTRKRPVGPRVSPSFRWFSPVRCRDSPGCTRST